jgi:CheY-like chemotaxis protein
MAAVAAAEDAASAGGGPPSGAGLRRILVASADDPLRALLREIFSGDGAEVIEASDAISTLRLARQMMPDGVVLDLLMEGGEALTMLGDLRQDRRTEGIPVLPISVVMQGDRLRAGAVSFQPKPLDRDRFLAAVRSAVGEDSGKPGRVLVVDDDRYVAEAVGALLAQQGMEVQLAAGGEEALLAAREDRPDLIVLDLKMPGLDGVAVIRRLRALPETVDRPVILMTAHDIPREDQTGWPGVDLSREMFARGARAALREAALR